jgi:hypothetical protein
VIIQHLANLRSGCPADSSSLASCISALKISISALESSIKTTDGSSGQWETFGWLCAIVVGVGVAGEIVVIVSEHLEGLEDWRRGIISPPDRPPAWRFWFDIAATLLVVGGVFGEAGATGMVASINSQLRSKTSELRAESDQLLALVTQEAGEAKDSALIAKASADAAEEKSERAEASASRALTSTNEARNELSVVKQETVLAKNDLQELRENIRPRRLTKEQQDNFRSVLVDSGLPPPFPTIPISVYIGAEDGAIFAQDVKDAIESAPGWHASISLSGLGGDEQGVAILRGVPMVPPYEPPWVGLLQQAFHAAGLDVGVEVSPNVKMHEAIVAIAPKKHK